MSSLDPFDPNVSAADMRGEAVEQLKSARELAKKVRGEAVQELEEARARVRRIAVREEEMAERWAKLLEAENQMMVAGVSIVSSDPSELIQEAQAEARSIIERAQAEARGIREDAMRLLAVAEGEKAESHEIAQSETERAITEAQRLRSEAEEEAERLRHEAERVSAGSDDSRYSRSGRKLPRIGASASNLLSEMSDLRAKSGEDEPDRRVS